jgi:hypothetical protein
MAVKTKSGPFLVISHSEKGSFKLFLMDDNDNGPAYYQADKELCTKKIYSKGVIVNGEKTTDYERISQYVQEADEEIDRIVMSAYAAGKRTTDDDVTKKMAPYLESKRIDEDRNECMSNLGWVTRMGKKADLAEKDQSK